MKTIRASVWFGAAALLWAVISLAPPAAAQDAMGWEQVPPADFNRIKPADFADDELRFVLPLFHFHTVANSVVEQGETRGFIDLPVWRDPKDNKPYNARILENHVAFAFFYTADRPWNPYRGSLAVRQRLEAILDFWTRSQNQKGLFAEYSPDNFSLAPTGFGVRHMMVTLELLEAGGQPIDPALKARVIAAQRKAILALIGDDVILRAGANWSNQYSGVYAAALSFVKLYPDQADELLPLLKQRMTQAAELHQSPAGYMYEQAGPDWGYTLGVHQTNVVIAWPYARGTEYGEMLNEEARKLYRFASHNLVAQPDGKGFFTNYAVSSRTGQSYFTPRINSQSEYVELARPLSQTREEAAAALQAQRDSLEKQWGKWPEMKLPSGLAYPPTPFTDIDRVDWYPTDAQRRDALAKYPYLAAGNFIRQATDSRVPATYTFVRRPAYYACFTGGKRATDRQRYGLGLLWIEPMGAVLQGQAATDDRAWGTRAAGAKSIHEAGHLDVAYAVDSKPISPAPGWQDVPDGVLTARYKLGEQGEKTVTFNHDAIVVQVRHAGEFVEEIPLLAAAMPQTTGGAVRMQGPGGSSLLIEPAGDVKLEVKGTGAKIGGLDLVMVKIAGRDALTYRLAPSAGAGK